MRAQIVSNYPYIEMGQAHRAHGGVKHVLLDQTLLTQGQKQRQRKQKPKKIYKENNATVHLVLIKSTLTNFM